MNFKNRLYFMVLSALCYASCASSGQLGGGPRDKTAPKVLSEKSASSKAINFKRQDLEFFFDEYVEVKEVNKEVIVSPPLVYLPILKARGKKVIFQFNEKEVLKPETTYTIDFGGAIRDFTEGNKVVGMKYVFSTGDKIDTLSVKGNIIDLEKNEPIKGATVMLYDNLSDTIVYKKKPYYAAKTNDKGEYEITNIKQGKYQIIAIKDENNSFTYDENNEIVGFREEVITCDTSLHEKINLVLSKADPKPRVIGKNLDQKGLAKVKLNYNPQVLPRYTTKPKLDFAYMDQFRDSLYLWYEYNENTDSLLWQLEFDTIKIDFKKLKPIAKDSVMLTSILNTASFINGDTILLKSNLPLKTLAMDRLMMKDSTSTVKAKVELKNPFLIAINAQLKSKGKYSLQLLPDFAVARNGMSHDTFEMKVSVVDMDQLGAFKIQLDSLDTMKQYIVTLQLGDKKIVQQTISSKNSATVEKQKLKADEYKLIIIEDINRNGILDGINYKEKRQAEKIKTIKLEKLKEGWTQEVNININNEQKE